MADHLKTGGRPFFFALFGGFTGRLSSGRCCYLLLLKKS
jgi:hypothetical protein